MAPVERRRLRLAGRVQGVGLRPWAARTARSLALAGFARNAADGLELALEGEAPAIEAFLAALRRTPPAGAAIEAIAVRAETPRGNAGFAIAASAAGAGASARRIPLDAPLCEACLDEIFDPRDRRHRHAFAHCAQCGPRSAILTALPWDRARTTLAGFAMCAACRREYDDPGDRRYHAETIACPACGPTLRAWAPDGRSLDGDPVERAAAVLRAGGLVAVKGGGGYHLAADATSADAIAALRKRKGRPVKPFAVLVPDLAAARALAALVPADEALLAGSERGVVVAPRRAAAGEGAPALADGVAPGVRDIGLMLPHAPVQWLLLFAPGSTPRCDAPRLPALVYTSANASGEPTLHDDGAARRALAAVADLVLAHDRLVARPNDDPVFRSAPGGPIPLRLARGTAPRVLRLPGGLAAPVPIVAVGGDLAAAPALAIGGEVLLGEHVGDLASAAAADALEARVRAWCRLLGVAPAVAAHDLHPDYVGTRLAGALAPRTAAVQHHHAHAAACLVEHGERGPALALALDGIGFGPDGAPWGGELLRVDLVHAERLGHLERVPLAGGAAAAREPWRMAAAWLARAFADGPPPPPLPWHARRDPVRLRAVEALAARGDAARGTSSCGRLFDAVASLLDCCDAATHEGEAAAALEALASAHPAASRPAPSGPGARRGRAAGMSSPTRAPGAPPAVVEAASLVRDVVRAHAAGRPRAALALAFHRGLAERLADAAVAHARHAALDTVVLTGGCLQNRLLCAALTTRLAAAGLRPLRHRQLPPGDGGLAVGQAAVAAARLATRGGAQPWAGRDGARGNRPVPG